MKLSWKGDFWGGWFSCAVMFGILDLAFSHGGSDPKFFSYVIAFVIYLVFWLALAWDWEI